MNKEDAKLLSDEDFEKPGRRRKIIIFIIILIMLTAAAIFGFRFLKKTSDNDINVTQPEISMDNSNKEEVEDETTALENETAYDSGEKAENNQSSPGLVRTTETGEHEFICEYSEIRLPELLKPGDNADVRLSLADGRNYTVVSGKKIMDFNKSESKSLIYLALCEEEIIILESALADLKLFEGSKLYLSIGNQGNIINYPVNKNADKLLHPKKAANNLSGYNYQVKFDKELEKERLMLKKALGLRGQEWKEAASYWNDKE